MNINPLELLKNAQAMKESMAKMQEELQNIEETGSSGGGLVKITMNGKFELLKVEIDPIAVDPRDVPMLQDLILAASKQASEKIQEALKAKMGPMMGNMNIPGLF
ncbi:MAG: YbaB/EbfC family nucleoid-associated protein [Spirochaetaceae bacterium]|nr:YbaB/EbfC family nucleoid-associated protein [Spirochaetaceae bacterium]